MDRDNVVPTTAAPGLQAMIVPGWECPVCRQSGKDVRVVLHHDHLEDYVTWLMANPTALLDAEGRTFGHVYDHDLLSRFISTVRGFAPTFICTSCNELDGTKLKQLGAHRFFSLSPADLAAIYRVDGKHDREQSFQLALALWRKRERVYAERLVEIAWMLRDQLMDGRWRKTSAEVEAKGVALMKLSQLGDCQPGSTPYSAEGANVTRALQHAGVDTGERHQQIVRQSQMKTPAACSEALPETSCLRQVVG